MNEDLDASTLPELKQMGLNMGWSDIWRANKGVANFSKRASHERAHQAFPVVTRQLRELRMSQTSRLFDRANRRRSSRNFA